jgi:colanic acid biosynthesis glycosyl transferase WcaI
MRILGISQWWMPEPAELVTSLLEALAARGHHLDVLTGFPNYPQGRLYDGYQLHARQTESKNGVRVVRTPLFPSHDNSGVRRVANYVSFAASSTVIGLPSVRRPDVAYVYHPPVTAAWAARLLRRLRGVPYVLHVQDLWPDAVLESGMLGDPVSHGFAGRKLENMVARTYASAARIVVISEGFRQRLLERGVPEAKVTVIPNWSPIAADTLPAVDVSLRSKMAPTKSRVILYAGNIGPFQNLDVIIRQVAALSATSRIHLAIMGDGIARSELERLVGSLGTHRVTFLPRCDASVAVGYQVAADVILVPLGGEGFLQSTIPSKLATALALGKPVFLPAGGDAAKLVASAGAGLSCPPDEASIQLALHQVDALSDEELRAFGDSGHRFYRQHLELPHAVRAFEKIFTQVASR